MISQRLKTIFAVSIPFFIAHGLEEIFNGFYNIDWSTKLIFGFLKGKDGAAGHIYHFSNYDVAGAYYYGFPNFKREVATAINVSTGNHFYCGTAPYLDGRQNMGLLPWSYNRNPSCDYRLSLLERINN